MNDSKPLLFTPIRFGRVEAKNRVMISPMCMYAAEDGFASTWHVAHLGARAIGGAGVVMMEATAVEARGRITDLCLGIYKDEHVEKLKEITEFIKSQGSVPGIQLSHAGRKGSRQAPWLGRDLPLPEDKAWEVIAPSAVPFEVSSIITSIVSLFSNSLSRMSIIWSQRKPLLAILQRFVPLLLLVQSELSKRDLKSSIFSLRMDTWSVRFFRHWPTFVPTNTVDRLTIGSVWRVRSSPTSRKYCLRIIPFSYESRVPI